MIPSPRHAREGPGFRCFHRRSGGVLSPLEQATQGRGQPWLQSLHDPGGRRVDAPSPGSFLRGLVSMPAGGPATETTEYWRKSDAPDA